MPDVTGDPPSMSGMPSETLYHRWLGWHALAMRRAIIVVSVGVIVALVLLRFATWELAVIGGWDAAALTFLRLNARDTDATTDELADLTLAVAAGKVGKPDVAVFFRVHGRKPGGRRTFPRRRR